MSEQPDAELACTLDPEQVDSRRDWMRDDVIPHLESVEEFDDGVELTFDDDAFAAVTTLVQKEADCCSFATFRLEYQPPYESLQVAVTWPAEADDGFREGFLEAFDDVPAPS